MAAACPRCDAPAQEGNFCTSCGYDLRPPGPAVVTPRHRAAPEPAPEVVRCPACGAPNAKSRRACGRCHASLTRTPVAVRDAPAPTPPAPPAPPSPAPGDFGPAVRAQAPPARPPWLLLGLFGGAALVFLGVTATLLIARGVGPFPARDGEVPVVEPLGVARVRASSAQAAEPSERLVDGDPETAWAEDSPGPGVGEWVEVALDTGARVGRVTIWNGDQRGERFLLRNRVRELRIDVAGERFTVELLDTQGPQVIELPRPVRADRLRLTVLSVYGASPDADTALSGVEIYGTPAD